MPRVARTVLAGLPHHVTQRGNYQSNVFFNKNDYITYTDWLKAYSNKYCVEILAYCLMTNHVHFVAVPETKNGLENLFKPLHMRYAQRINQKLDRKGHLWQGRYYSSPLDDQYLLSTILYVELNPVRANMVNIAEDYPWSSAAGHCGLRYDPIVRNKSDWSKHFESIPDWSEWLSTTNDIAQIETIRRNTAKGVPCGSDSFISKLEEQTGRCLKSRPIGRPKSSKKG